MLVKGGSLGMGAAIVRPLAADGAAVSFTYANGPGKANELVAATEKTGGRVLYIKANSTNIRIPQHGCYS
ncbi:MAG: hypothetical protein ABIN89_06795 [Chitinophagaceae bacterium]